MDDKFDCVISSYSAGSHGREAADLKLGIAMLDYVKLVVLCISVGGCGTSSVIVSKSYNSKNPNEVQVLFEPPSMPYEKLALINSHGVLAGSFGGNTTVAINKMKQEAAKVGADAVILSNGVSQSQVSYMNTNGTAYGNNFSLNTIGATGGAGDANISGVAIKFK
jgi:hypothetical protein